MTRRKGEITARMNERDFAHIVELRLPEGGFGTRLDEFEAFIACAASQARAAADSGATSKNMSAGASPAS